MVTFLFKKLCSCFVVYSTNVQPIKEMRGREKGGGKRIEKNKGRRKKKRGKVCEWEREWEESERLREAATRLPQVLQLHL